MGDVGCINDLQRLRYSSHIHLHLGWLVRGLLFRNPGSIRGPGKFVLNNNDIKEEKQLHTV